MRAFTWILSFSLCVISLSLLWACAVEGIKRLISYRRQKSLWNNGICPFSGKKWIRTPGLDYLKYRVYYDENGNRLTVTFSSIDGIYLN